MHSNHSSFQNSNINVLRIFWGKLAQVKHLSFNAKTKLQEKNGGWHRRGQGEVVVAKEGSNRLVFNEKGIWEGRSNREIRFSNVFRWTYCSIGAISLEHLRRGPSHPVFLIHLVPSGENSLSALDSHLCKEDIYFGQIYSNSYGLRLSWRVIGPKKNEEIEYCYT